jgi:hypothetical protein
MDRTLLEAQRGRPGTAAAVPTNNQPGTPETPEIEKSEVTEAVQAQEYRELVAPPPAPPLRMKLEPPVEFDGQTYSEIVCDFEKLIGADFIRLEREFRRTYKADKNEIPFAEMNPLYHVILISEASGLPRGLVRKLPGRYYTTLRTEALKCCGSSAEEKEA